MSIIVVDFKIDVQLTSAQNSQTLDLILKLFASHPKGNAIQFEQIHFNPKHCKFPEMMKDKRIPTPQPNYFSLFKKHQLAPFQGYEQLRDQVYFWILQMEQPWSHLFR